MHREMMQGIEKYRISAESFEQIKRFGDMGKASGRQLEHVVYAHVNMEKRCGANRPLGRTTSCP
ncbi:hypothetical protein [Bradyrhizobium sp. I71]|uniref:hypothetical protein n=1 Tax=Bradyrhizobium sp. I71 TaxID=2590772 RepID=UPI001EF7FC34|nr:hypothetical protein [Bradyrhizobium sp. I71]ULK95974.1 hypothetical protein FJV43_24885 [Bradyrhizobium sp. I71]